MNATKTPMLTPAERHRLRRWEIGMRTAFSAVMVGLALLVFGYLNDWLSARAEALLWTGLVIAALPVAVLQLSARCPRCGYRIGRHSALLLPHRCPNCSAPFRAGV